MLKPCRVCGNQFPACNGAQRGVSGMPNWRQFCCCLDCASEYYARIEASRAPQTIAAPIEAKPAVGTAVSTALDEVYVVPVEETEAPAEEVDEAVETQEENSVQETTSRKRRKTTVEE